MNAVSRERLTASEKEGAAGPAHSGRGVAIVHQGRDEGRAALRYARGLARRVGVPLTVVSIASRERTDVGCGSAREGAAFRNELAGELAAAHLTEARKVKMLGRRSSVSVIVTPDVADP